MKLDPSVRRSGVQEFGFPIRGKTMKLSGLERYRLTDDEATMFLVEFSLIMSDINLKIVDLNDPAIKALAKKNGVYFWMMRLGDRAYKIYAGKTNSLPRRLRDYKNEFQVHAPNDHKLRFFQSFMRDHHPDAELDLYFIDADSHTQKENEVVEKYSPLINEKASVSEAVRKEMKDAFSEYYASIFREKLGQQLDRIPSVVRLEVEEIVMKTNKEKGLKITNHDMIAAAVKDYRGKILEASEIKKMVLKSFPNFNVGSLLPNDHAFGNKNCCSCAGTERRIFDRAEPKKYLVR